MTEYDQYRIVLYPYESHFSIPRFRQQAKEAMVARTVPQTSMAFLRPPCPSGDVPAKMLPLARPATQSESAPRARR